VVDVLHLFRFPIADPGVDPFSPDAEERGSFGWLSRVLHAWQTRLLIIDVMTVAQAAMARRVAASVCARGGPGVVVRGASEPLEPLYTRLVHDMPLDALSSRFYGVGFSPKVDSLFAGAGREELARASAAVEELELLQREAKELELSLAGKPRLVAWMPLIRDLSRSRQSAGAVSGVVERYHTWSFDHESEGVLPMSESLHALRAVTHRLVRASRARARRVKPRYVNASLWHGGPDFGRVDARIERLVLDEPYQLALQIGARDRLIPVYEASVFKEIPRVAGSKGVWVEIAVNGVGFAVEGDAVQELWLPFEEPSDEMRFAVKPSRRGVAVLRYTIYYRQNVVQTYRLAALTRAGGGKRLDEFDTRQGRRLLARALNAPVRRMPREATYISRLEYQAASIPEATTLPERHASIVANDVEGERVITVKGRTFFIESTPTAAGDLVDAARSELFEISINKITPAREDWVARFGGNRGINEKTLQQLLPRLALAGFDMYDKLFAKDARDELEKTLVGVDAKIAVAHTLIEEVVPWALMYDRPYTDKVAPGSHLAVCTAAIPGASGKLTVTECGSSPACVLHQPGVNADNVACPLRFWGFRHQIELPPKQAHGVRNATAAPSVRPTPSAASASGAQRLAAAINARLASAEQHERDLKALQRPDGSKVVWEEIETKPDRVIEALSDPELDLVYLYCHARGGVGDPDKTKPPLLEFSDKSQTQRYRASQVQVVWKHRPLVIVNGCSTAAFSPDALSPFVEKFTRDCGAGGVIGTEIPVHEDLATRFMTRLLERVIGGESVGAALLAVRRELLGVDNPLGLAYTLYAFSEFKLSV